MPARGGNRRRRHQPERAAQPAQRPTPAAGPSLQEAFGDLVPPAAAPLRLPPGYSGGPDAIRDADGHLITSTPLLPLHEIHDLDVDTRSYEVALLTRAELRRFVVAAQEIRDVRKILSLANRGLDVTSRTAARLVDFLAAYLRDNLLPRIRITRRLGWRPHEDGGSYLLAEAHPADDSVQFADDTEQAKAFRAALRPKGTLEKVRVLVELLAPFPTVLTSLCAALAPAVRECLKLDAPSVLLHLVAPSSTGKTVTQRVALSVWADPFSPTWLIHGHGTYAGIEALCARTFGLPVPVQDLQLLREEDLTKLIYAVGNEAWKARGGDRRWIQLPWRGWLLTSGELPLLHAGSYGGEAARVLTLSGPPLGPPNADTRELINGRILPMLQGNHGLLGPAVVDFLLRAVPKDHDALRASWEEVRDHLARDAADHPILARQAPQWALLTVTARIATRVLELPDPELLPKAIAESFEAARAETPPDPVEHAYEQILSWAQGNRAFFYTRDASETHPPHPGRPVSGLINEAEGWLAIYPHSLRLACQQLNLPAPEILLRAWRQREYLHAQGDRLTRVVKLGGRPVRLYVVRIPAEKENP